MRQRRGRTTDGAAAQTLKALTRKTAVCTDQPLSAIQTVVERHQEQLRTFPIHTWRNWPSLTSLRAVSTDLTLSISRNIPLLILLSTNPLLDLRAILTSVLAPSIRLPNHTGNARLE